MNCCFCGPVKNCEPYLDKVFENIEKLGSLFHDYRIIVYYDKSSDNTLKKLKDYQIKNPRFFFYVNHHPISKFRTHNLAIARNWCLNYVRKNKDYFPFFVMMDFDDVNCKQVHPETLENHLQREDWDALSFHTSPQYYDIWALSIYPYCFSYNHFSNNVYHYTIIQNYVSHLLKNLPTNQLLPCISAFNGFSIYRTNNFLNTYYDGRVRLDIVPPKNLKSHMNASKSKLVFKKYVTVDGRYEDCEHRAFHIQATRNSHAKIRISPNVLFS
jgi:glycosyltransferase involved in cell wall biosynthesis